MSDKPTKPLPWDEHIKGVRPWLVWLWGIEWYLEWGVYNLKRFALVDLLDIAAKFTILITLISYLLGAEGRKTEQIAQHWQVLMNSKQLNGGPMAIDALEHLNKMGASMRGIKMEDFYLQGVKLEEVDLRNSKMKFSNLRNSTFYNAKLEEANFENADLRGADLRSIQCKEAIFKNADLRNAILNDVDFIEADFTGAILEYAKVSSLSWINDQRKHNVIGINEISKKYYINDDPIKGVDNQVFYFILEKEEQTAPSNPGRATQDENIPSGATGT